MHEILLGEFIGTLILVLLGNGVVAGVLLKGSKAEGGGWIVITAGWAFAVMAGVFTAAACGSNAAHLNPAITLGFALASGDWTKAAPMIVAQLLGAFAGACLVWVHFYPHWAKTTDYRAKLDCFCTSPAIRNTPANLASEMIATFVLVFVVAAISSKAGDRDRRSNCRTRTVSRGESRMGNRHVAGRDNWICDQPSQRPRAAARAFRVADFRQK